MIQLTSSTLIEMPVKRVFDFVSTPENNFRWHYGTLAASRLAEGISSKGTFFRSIVHWVGLALAPTLGTPVLSLSPMGTFLAAAAIATVAAGSALALERRLPEGTRLTPRPLDAAATAPTAPR